MRYVYLLVVVTACSGSAGDHGEPSGADAGGKPAKPAPASAAEAPVLEAFESSTPQTTPTGNTPMPHGVRCEPTSDTPSDIVYTCTVWVSKTQKASDSGYTCGARDVKITTSSGSQDVTATSATKPASFALSIAKATFPTLLGVKLVASCSTQGGGIQINRPYSLEPLP